MSNEWPVKPLSEVIGLRRGFDLPNALRAEGPYPILSAGTQVGSHSEARVKGPGFAVGRATNLGVPQWSDTDFWPLNTTLFAEDYKGNDARWLYRLFQTLDLSGFDSGSVQPMLNRNYIAQVPVAVPPLPVQEAIAEVLGALDDKIAANRRAMESGRGLLLASWDHRCQRATPRETRAWSDIAQTNPKVSVVKGESAPYLDMNNLPESGLLVQDWGARAPQGGARFHNGDTLFARITPCFENGKHAYVDFLGEGETGYGSTEYIVFRAHRGISPMIPFVISASREFRAFAAQHRTGTSGRQRVQARDLVHYEVAWPGDAAAAEFGAFAEALVARLGAARDETRALAKTRDELLPLLMSGKITVKDAEKTVEGVV